MKTTSRISIVIVTCCAYACTPTQEYLELGEAKSVLNLHLYPVHANRTFIENHKNFGRYLTLKEAVDNDMVVVTEHVSSINPNIEAQAAVNTLFIENLSSDTVLILNGEMVTGGKQDRMVTQDVVLVPHSGKLDLAVFCVEHGRWTGDNLFSVSEQSLPPNSVRNVASTDKEQEDVWDEVKVNLDVNVVESPSDALLDLKLSEGYAKKISQYTEVLAKSFANGDDIIGVLAVSGDEVIACDLFATPELFAKHYPNLLQSYAGQAQYDDDKMVKPEVIGNYWRRVMKTIKSKDGFLSTGDESSRRNVQAHFSMGIELN